MVSLARPGTQGLVIAVVFISLVILLSQLGYLYHGSSHGLPNWLAFGSSGKGMTAWQRDLAFAASETGQYSSARLGETVLSVIENQPAESQEDLVNFLTGALKELNMALKKPFVEMAMNTSIGGVADFAAVRTLCRSKSWRNDVVFKCEGFEGEAEDVRTQLLTCLRFAIESGAGIIVPEAMSNDTGVEYLFDQNRSLRSLGEACPELPLHASLDTLNTTSPHGIMLVNPQSWLGVFKHSPITGTVLADPQDWKSQFDQWLHLFNITSSERVAVIPIETLAGKFPICHDTNPFVSTFGQILSFQPDIQRLAASILHHLSIRYSLNLDPAVGIYPNAFLGIHLPDPQDDTHLSGVGYLEHIGRYLHMASDHDLKIIYVAAASHETVQQFANVAEGRIIVTKDELLSADERAELAELSHDQQALVDHLVLQKASFFGGSVQSGTDWNVALSRRAAAGVKLCPEDTWLPVDGVDGVIRQHEAGGLQSAPGKALLVDAWSEITGRPESVTWAQTVWP
ncbi:MAG: hypothetical protein M1818_001183 [Claussenomyces sp. TS43310]|nr:MAG: hypothetical protein M1818_001183 [Claussenomyces sp. TS43310]